MSRVSSNAIEVSCTQQEPSLIDKRRIAKLEMELELVKQHLVSVTNEIVAVKRSIPSKKNMYNLVRELFEDINGKFTNEHRELVKKARILASKLREVE